MNKDIVDDVIIKLRELLSSSLIVLPVVVVVGRTMRTREEGTANPFAMSTAHATSIMMAQVNRLAVVMMILCTPILICHDGSGYIVGI
jgi:hypothetical protein